MSVNNDLTPKKNSAFIRGTYSCIRKTPLLNKVIRTENSWKNVVNVSVEVLKGLGIVFAGASFGALAGVSFEGWIPVVICAGVGAFAAGTAYAVAKVAMLLIQKFGYPASRFIEDKPLSHDDWFSDENREHFDKYLKTLKNETWYKNWQKLHKNKGTDRFLWRQLQKGTCYGEASAILQAVQKNPAMRTSKILRKVKVKTIFQKQILEIIRADITKALIGKDSGLNGIKRAELETDLQKVVDLTKKVDNAQMTPSEHIPKASILNPQKFSETLKKLYEQTEKSHPNRTYTALVRLESSKKAHSLFVQFSGKHFRIYDSYNAKTGFYRFQDKASLDTNLQKILKSYIKMPSLSFHTYRDAKIQFYAV